MSPSGWSPQKTFWGEGGLSRTTLNLLSATFKGYDTQKQLPVPATTKRWL